MFTSGRSAIASRTRLVRCIRKERSVPPGASWTPGSRPFPNPGRSPWKRRSSLGGSTIICFRTRKSEGGTPSDVACDSRGQEEERPDRCRQDRRLPALRLPAGVLHDFHRDPGPAPDAALPESCAEADGADEEPHFGSAYGDRSELQQAAAAQAGLLHGTDVEQRRGEREYPAVVEAQPGD